MFSASSCCTRYVSDLFEFTPCPASFHRPVTNQSYILILSPLESSQTHTLNIFMEHFGSPLDSDCATSRKARDPLDHPQLSLISRPADILCSSYNEPNLPETFAARVPTNDPSSFEEFPRLRLPLELRVKTGDPRSREIWSDRGRGRLMFDTHYGGKYQPERNRACHRRPLACGDFDSLNRRWILCG